MENDVNLNELNASEILKPPELKSYEETLDLICREVLRLRSYLYILDKLIRFPSDLFLEPERQTFLELAKITFTESALLIITKLTTDTGKDVLSMRRFKNWAQERIRPEYQKAFYKLLRENRFTKTTEESRKKVRKIRNNLFAHLIVDKNMRPKNSLYAIPFEEMNLIANELKRLFDALCFNCEYPTLPDGYDPDVKHPAGSDTRPDIEYFLDLIVQDSYLFKMPDESQYWDIEKQKLSPEMIGILNKYRRKFGKPEV